MDSVDKATRSRIMAAIGPKDTAPELLLRKALHREGFRYTLHDKRLPGSPDIAFPKYGAAVFVHGCFWHAHDCGRFKAPATRPEFWREKFRCNRARDRRKIDDLAAAGWRVMVVWECALPPRDARRTAKTVERVARWLSGNRRRGEARG